MKDNKQIISFLNKSLAFLESAHILSLQKDNDLYDTYEYNDVISSQIFHSTELFLKFGILSKTPIEKRKKVLKSFDHSLQKLYFKYRKKYPEEEYEIDIIFDNAIKNELNKDELKLPNFPMDIILRYPSSKDGIYHFGVYGYDMTSDFLEKRKQLFETLGSEIIKVMESA